MNPIVKTKQAQVDLNAAALKVSFGFARQAKVLAVGLVFRNSAAATGTVTVSKRILAGSASGEVTIGTITKPASNVQGKYYYQNLDDASITVDSGDEICFTTSVDPATSTLAECFVEYLDLPESRLNLADAVKVTA